MHNGQIGGFDQFRKQADMMIADDLYAHRKGASDSEVLFLLALDAAKNATLKEAFQIAVAQLEAQARRVNATPFMRIAAAVSDGQSLYAIRYASDAHAPSLFYQWNEAWQGWAVVSEPYETASGAWIEVPQGSFCQFKADDLEITPFCPRASAQIYAPGRF